MRCMCVCVCVVRVGACVCVWCMWVHACGTCTHTHAPHVHTTHTPHTYPTYAPHTCSTNTHTCISNRPSLSLCSKECNMARHCTLVYLTLGQENTYTLLELPSHVISLGYNDVYVLPCPRSMQILINFTLGVYRFTYRFVSSTIKPRISLSKNWSRKSMG